MDELVGQQRGELFQCGLRGFAGPQALAGLFQCFVAVLFGLGSEAADGADGSLCAQPGEKMGDFDVDDFLGLLGGFLSGPQVFLDGVAEIVNGVQVNVPQLLYFRFDITRYGQIDHEHGFATAGLECGFDAALAQYGELAGGRGDHDVGTGQVSGEFGEGNGEAVKLLGQCVGAVVGAVGNDELADTVFAEVAGGEFDGFARADEDGGLLAQIFKNAAGETDGGERHGHRTGAYGGVGADFFGSGEGVLEQFAQGLAQRSGFGGGLIGCFHLPEDLRFAQNHGVESGGDPEHVADAVGVVVGVEEGEEVFAANALLFGYPVEQGGVLACVAAEVEFGAVAGGEDRGLFNAGNPPQVFEGVQHLIGRERQSFPDRDGCGCVVQSYRYDGHRLTCRLLSAYNSKEKRGSGQIGCDGADISWPCSRSGDRRFNFTEFGNSLVFKRLQYWFLAGALWTSGCVGGGASSLAAGGAPSGEQALDDHAEPVYLVLAAEIAGQRGQYEVALDSYLKLSRLTPDPKVAERATQIALYVKDAPKALEAATLWLEREPGNLAATRVLAMLEVRAGRMDEAEKAFRHLLDLRDPQLEDTLVDMVKWLDAEAAGEQSLKTMQALSGRFPKVPEMHFAYALLASNRGLDALAREELDQALALRPGWGRARLLDVQLVAQTGNVKAAQAAVARALQANPGNPRLRLIQAQMLAKSGNLKGAERELQALLVKDYGDHDARFALASVWMDMGQHDRARHEFESLVDDPRWQVQSSFSLGVIDVRQGRLESALKRFDSVAGSPMAFDASLNAVSALAGLERYGEARSRLAEIRKRFPNEAVRLYLIESDLLSRGREFQSAHDALSEAITQSPGQPDLLYARAMVAEHLGRLDLLEADLKQVLVQKPEDPLALNALGFSLADHGGDRLTEAEDYIRRALAKRPGDPAILDSYGWVLYRRGKTQEALTPLRKAYGLFRDPEIAAHLGEVLWVSGQKAEARKVWAEGFRKNPEQDDILRVRKAYPEGFAAPVKAKSK